MASSDGLDQPTHLTQWGVVKVVFTVSLSALKLVFERCPGLYFKIDSDDGVVRRFNANSTSWHVDVIHKRCIGCSGKTEVQAMCGHVCMFNTNMSRHTHTHTHARGWQTRSHLDDGASPRRLNQPDRGLALRWLEVVHGPSKVPARG